MFAPELNNNISTNLSPRAHLDLLKAHKFAAGLAYRHPGTSAWNRFEERAEIKSNTLFEAKLSIVAFGKKSKRLGLAGF